jgi:integrase
VLSGARGKRGRHLIGRVRTYVNTLLRHGVTNGWYAAPSTGTDWVSPACDPESVRQGKLRAGLKDYSDRIVSGGEIDKLLGRSTPVFKAIVLMGINAALGPADIGRLRWAHVNLRTGRLKFPRPKTGVMRVAYLWKKTRMALLKVRATEQSAAAITKDGEEALVFLTRRNLAYYREREVHQEMEIDGKKVNKLVRVAVENALSITFRRMVKELELEGVHFYRLRHTFKTLAKRAKDKEAIDPPLPQLTNNSMALRLRRTCVATQVTLFFHASRRISVYH